MLYRFGDAFHDVSIPSHLVTREFNEIIRKNLNFRGVYIVNVVDSSFRPRFLFSFVKTLSLSFPAVEVWFEAGVKRNSVRVTFTVVASNSFIDEEYLYSEKGHERSWWRWPEVKLNQAVSLLDVPILTDDKAPVNKLMSSTILDKKL